MVSGTVYVNSGMVSGAARRECSAGLLGRWPLERLPIRNEAEPPSQPAARRCRKVWFGSSSTFRASARNVRYASDRYRNGEPLKRRRANGNNFSNQFPQIVAVLTVLPVRSCLIDGEAVVCNETGLTVFDLIARMS